MKFVMAAVAVITRRTRSGWTDIKPSLAGRFPGIRPAVLLGLFTAWSYLWTVPAEAQKGCTAATTTASMETCEAARLLAAEGGLSKAQTQLKQKLDPIGNTKLRVSQAAWLKFRITNAALAADTARGGTLAPLIRITVMADMTEARSIELKKLLQP